MGQPMKKIATACSTLTTVHTTSTSTATVSLTIEDPSKEHVKKTRLPQHYWLPSGRHDLPKIDGLFSLPLFRWPNPDRRTTTCIPPNVKIPTLTSFFLRNTALSLQNSLRTLQKCHNAWKWRRGNRSPTVWRAEVSGNDAARSARVAMMCCLGRRIRSSKVETTVKLAPARL